MKKICVAGVGAVGGLLSAMLGQNPEVELSVIARGEKARSFKENGIVLHSDFYGEQVARPVHIASNGADLPIMDAILLCVKNYSLDEMTELIGPAIGPETVLLPVMNGIEAPGKLRQAFPGRHVGESCIYTVSFMDKDYSIRQIGPYTHMFAGCTPTGDKAAVYEVLEVIRASGFDCRISENIEGEIWQKFILNCAYNTLTARYMVNSGEIRDNPLYREELHALLEEAAAEGFQLGIRIPEDIVEQKFSFMMEKQPPTATSSMRRDLEKGLPIELDAFTGAILRKGEALGIDVPMTRRFHEELQRCEDLARQ